MATITLERCQAIAKKHGGKCLKVWKENGRTRGRFACANGHEWETDCRFVIFRGSWCKRCNAKRLNEKNKIGLTRCQQIAIKRDGLCLSKEYENAHIPMQWYCNKHDYTWNASANTIVVGHWCRKCGNERATKAQAHRKIGLERCRQVALKYDGLCLSDKYVNAQTPMRWYCKKHKMEWTASAGSVISAGHWCMKCGRERTTNAQIPRKIGLERCRQVALEHDGLCLATEYINNQTPMKWHCNEHNFEWVAIAGSIIGGGWCPKCADDARRQKFTLKDGIEQCRQIAKDRNGKCLSQEYINGTTLMEWRCGQCGRKWPASFKSIKRGSWCPYCLSNTTEARCRIILETIFNRPFKKCKPFKHLGSYLEIDCYNEELQLGAEYDGYQHRTISSHFTNEKARPIWERDQEKNQLCEQSGICLIRINDLEATQETLVDTIIRKLRSKNIPFTMPTDTVLTNLRNPTDPIYRSVWGSDYLEILKKECERRGGRLISSDVWAGSGHKYNIECAKGHRFASKYSNVVHLHQWCPECTHRVPIGIERCRQLANKLNGLCLSNKYVNARSNLKWYCKIHNYTWFACWDNVSHGHWCPKCGYEQRINNRRAKRLANSSK